MPTADIESVLGDIAKSINSRFKLEVAVPGTGHSSSDVDHWIPTKSVLLNLLFGNENYGVPVGRIIEVFGDFSHGKSTVLQILMNAFQAAGGISNLLDAESGWNRERAVAMGHDSKRHMIVEVDTVESGFSVLQELNEKYRKTFSGYVPILYGWDTIAASPTNGEKNNDEYANGMMYKARLIRAELRKFARELPKANATLIIVNQTIEGPKENTSGVKTTPGGGGVKFWSSQRLQVTRVATYNNPETKKPIGIISNCKMVKNKLGAPFRSIDLPINYAQGVDTYREVFNYLLDNSSVVNLNGAYKKIVGFGQKDLSFYDKDYVNVLKANPGLYDWLVEQCKATWLGVAEAEIEAAVDELDPEDVEEAV